MRFSCSSSHNFPHYYLLLITQCSLSTSLLSATFDLPTVVELGACYLSRRESEGLFQYGNYRKEADDLRSVVSYFSEQKYDIIALVGHSKGR